MRQSPTQMEVTGNMDPGLDALVREELSHLTLSLWRLWRKPGSSRGRGKRGQEKEGKGRRG